MLLRWLSLCYQQSGVHAGVLNSIPRVGHRQKPSVPTCVLPARARKLKCQAYNPIRCLEEKTEYKEPSSMKKKGAKNLDQSEERITP